MSKTMDVDLWLKSNGDRNRSDLLNDKFGGYVVMSNGYGGLVKVYLTGKKVYLSEVQYCKKHEVSREEVVCPLCINLNKVVEKFIVKRFGI